MNVYPFIEAEKQGQGCVRRACVLLNVSRTAYYAWSAAGSEEERRRADDELLVAIKDAHQASRGAYGSPRITRALRGRGLRVSRKRVACLMRQRGIVGRARRRQRTTIADPAAALTADLLQRNFSPASHAIDAAWCSDISYVRTWEGWTYLATVIDLSSRRIVGLAMADHLRTALVSEALEMALAQRRPEPGLIFYTDRGCQYRSSTCAWSTTARRSASVPTCCSAGFRCCSPPSPRMRATRAVRTCAASLSGSSSAAFANRPAASANAPNSPRRSTPSSPSSSWSSLRASRR